MNSSSKSKLKPKPNKTATAQVEPASKTSKNTTPASVAKAKTRKDAKPLKSAATPEGTRGAKTPAPKKTKAQARDKKPKLVHDRYSLPKDEDVALDTLKQRVTALGLKVKKNSLLRAGLLALGKLGDAAVLEALRALPEPIHAVTSGDAPKSAKEKPAKTKAAKAPKKTGKSSKPATPETGADATHAP
ncbi:hypothetical protein DW355_14825 [Hylemonella gracilis]|uniref:Uncharacterized protein n=1 Tax=Hylemonella gracilis TaxID=80880 RepID=A0A4P6UP00_9BURK|nr:hypothetical protein [Hylemonella gracilis]QBK05827.1 hypothetical protein DW355_14825 [Hylemonella gracilis]